MVMSEFDRFGAATHSSSTNVANSDWDFLLSMISISLLDFRDNSIRECSHIKTRGCPSMKQKHSQDELRPNVNNARDRVFRTSRNLSGSKARGVSVHV